MGGLQRVVTAVAVLLSARVAGARTLTGVVYADDNGDGTQDGAEAGIAGAVVAFETSAFTRTDASGAFTLTVPDGLTGNVWVRTPAGYAIGLPWAPSTGALRFGLRPGRPPTGPVTFVLASDTHMSPIADWAQDLGAASAAATAARPAPDFFTVTGDVTQGDTGDECALVDAQTTSLTVPFVRVPGNHDWTSDGGAQWREHYGPESYSFDVGAVHFVVWNMCMNVADCGMQDDASIDRFLAADLSLVDPSMTIVAMSHAPPQPATIDALESYGVRYVLTGHTHTNRVVDHGDLIEINSEPMLMGGLDFTPAGYRVVTIDPAAEALTMAHHTVVAAPVARLVSPAAGECVSPSGGRLLVAAELDGGVASVSATVDDAQVLGGESVGGWTYAIALPPLPAGTHHAALVGASTSGARVPFAADFEVCEASQLAAPASAWPQPGGGPTHAGAVAEQLLTPLARAWTAPVGGHVLQQGPVIAGGLVIETATDLADDRAGSIVALDAATGAQVWRVAAHARAGADVEGDVVVVPQVDGTVLGLELATGAQRFSVDLGQGVRSEALHVMSSAVSDAGIAFVGNEHALAAIDTATGDALWTVDPLSVAFDFATVDTLAVDDARVIGSFSRSTGVGAWDRRTGAVVWMHSNDDMTGVNAAPVIVGDTLYLAGADGTVSAWSASSGDRQWDHSVDPIDMLNTWSDAIAAAPAVSGHVLVVSTLYQDLVALDTRDGHELWRHAAAGASPLRTTHYRGAGTSGYEASPVIAGGVVWAADTSGVLVALDLESGAELWSVDLGVPVLASPAIADGWLYVASYDGTLHAFQTTVVAAPADGGCDAGGSGSGGGVVVLLGFAPLGASRRRRRRPRR